MLFKIGDAATDDKIECLQSFAEVIDEQLSMSNTKKTEVSKAKDFLMFVIVHCHLRQYFIQIRKCNDPSCCRPVLLLQEVLPIYINWLPDSLLSQWINLTTSNLKKFLGLKH